MVIQEVFEVLFSPVKAFKKIIEKPEFKGVILVIVLAISVLMIQQYVASSKLYIEDRFPENDSWTEALTGQHTWVSNGSLFLDATDYQMGNIDGNHSISSSATTTNVWLKVIDIGSVNCLEENGYIELFFWIKWINDAGSFPSSGTVKLFSGYGESYFESDVTDFLASSGDWTNITLTIGPGQDWTSYNSPNWQNITAIEFNLDWSFSTYLTMKIDGLFFRRYSSPIVNGDFSAAFPSILLQVVLNFAMSWILWAGLLIIVAKLFNEDLGQWNTFFVVIGYSFIATVVYIVINIGPLLSLPPLNVPLDVNAFTALIDVSWRPLLAYQLWLYIPVIGEVWIAALGAIAVYVKKEMAWSKAATIAAIAFAIRFILSLIFGF